MKVIPAQERQSFFRAIMESTDSKVQISGYKLPDGRYLKYMGKSDTEGHEEDDVFVLLPKDSNYTSEKIRFVGGIDKSHDNNLKDLIIEVKTYSPETEFVKAIHYGGRRRKNRRGTKRPLRNRRRSSRKN
jgi:hypothetical protein